MEDNSENKKHFLSIFCKMRCYNLTFTGYWKCKKWLISGKMQLPHSQAVLKEYLYFNFWAKYFKLPMT